MYSEKLNHTLTEAGLRLNVSRSTLYRLINSGQLRIVKIGDRTLVPETELQSLQERLLQAGSTSCRAA